MTAEISAIRPGRLGRRRFIALGVSAAIVSLSKPANAHLTAPPRRIYLLNAHTGESFRDIYYEKGAYLPDALRELKILLRDHANDKIHEIDPLLIDLLADLRSRLKLTQPFHVVSAYRSPETNAAARRRNRNVARNSLHMHGMAVDVRVPDLDTQILRRAAVAMQAGGVGLYPRSNFVHLDVGPVRTW